MSETADVVISRALALRNNGAICHAELWHIVADLLEEEPNAVNKTLDRLPESLKVLLRDAFEHDPSAVHADVFPSAVRRGIIDWCND